MPKMPGPSASSDQAIPRSPGTPPDSPTRVPIGERVGQRRRELGWTQAELGLRAGGLSQAAISLIESGSKVPSYESLEAIAAALGYTVELLELEPPGGTPGGAT